MAVEYIDSPTGVIGLGEGVGLETITPQRRRRVRRGDRGIFPVTPTGAESYEDPSFAPQRGFQQAYGAVPNVFERYAGLPGGARAGPIPGSGFEDVIFRPLPTDDVVEDDNDLDEELRRQTLDINLDFDPSGRTDPDSPNYDPVAIGQTGVAELFNIPSGGSTFTDPNTGEAVTLFSDGFTAEDVGTYANIRGMDARTISHALQQTAGGSRYARGLEQQTEKGIAGAFSRLNRAISERLGLPVISDEEFENRSAAIFGAGEAARQVEQYTGRGSRQPILGTREQTEIERMQSQQLGTPTIPTAGMPVQQLAALRSSLSVGFGNPSTSADAKAGEYSTAGPPSVLSAPFTGFTGAGSAPIVGSTPELGSRISRLQEIQQERAALQAQSDAADAAPEFSFTPDAGGGITIDTEFGPESFGGDFVANRGGTVSFMGMKK